MVCVYFYTKSTSFFSQGSIAYVPQEPWVRNMTVEQNILLGQRMVRRRYEKVLDACALRPDLEVLEDGDQTEIGEKVRINYYT